MPGVRPQRISGHSPYEPVFGFSRALVAGDRVLVAGTAPVPPGGGPPPAGPYAQARLCLDLIGEALAKAGTSLEHVVRTRMYLTAAEHWEQVARAHGEVFAEVRPVATAVIVAGLLDPAWLVEIEAEALLPEALSRSGFGHGNFQRALARQDRAPPRAQQRPGASPRSGLRPRRAQDSARGGRVDTQRTPIAARTRLPARRHAQASGRGIPARIMSTTSAMNSPVIGR
jgi:enamine deaminase RidA (YjgF/YER057c/UK114 family)